MVNESSIKSGFKRKFQKLPIYFLIILLSIFVLAAGFLIYSIQKSNAEDDAYEKIQTIAELKLNFINRWFKETLSDVEVISNNPARNYLFFNPESYTQNKALKYELSTWFKLISQQYGYESVFLTTEDGKLLVSSDDSESALDSVAALFVKNASKNRKTTFTDFYKCKLHNKIHLDFISPIVDDHNSIKSIIIFRIDPEVLLYPILQSWDTPQGTAETLIVRQDGDSVLFLNELKYVQNSALNISLPLSDSSVPAVMAVRGYSGVFEGIDYRGIKVLSYLTNITDTPWFLVTKIDKEEVLAEFRERALIIGIFTLFTLVVAAGGVSWYNQLLQRNTYKDLFEKERLLREQEEEIKTTLYNLVDAVITTNTNGLVRRMNKAAERLTGWKESEAVGKKLEDILILKAEDSDTNTAPSFTDILKSVESNPRPAQFTLISKEGDQTLVEESAAPILDSNEKLLGIVVVIRDLTESKILQKSKEESEQRFKALFDQAVAGIALSSLNGKLIQANDEFKEITRYTDMKMGNKSIEELLFPSGSPEFQKQNDLLLKGDIDSYTLEFPFKNNSNDRWIRLTSSLVAEIDGEPKFFVNIINDITENKAYEDKLKTSDKIFNHSLDMLCIAGFDGYFKVLNPAWEKTLGWSRQELLSKPWIEFVHPDDRNNTQNIKVELDEGHEIYRFENRYLHKDGREVWLSWNSFPYPTENILFGVARDITEQKKMREELIKLNENLEDIVNTRTAQLESAVNELESFSYSVSHDLRSPLRAISGFTRILFEEYYDNLDDNAKELMQDILDNTKNMNVLIDKLLEFSRLSRRGLSKDDIDMNTLAKDVIREIQIGSPGQNFKFIIEDLPRVHADLFLMKQVLLNLFSNAAKFSSKRHESVIRISGSEDKDFCHYSISDNGVGFDTKYVDKIFLVFQRLHSSTEFEGTGVGLAIVQRIITRHGGKISAESEIDKGTTFHFSLPK